MRGAIARPVLAAIALLLAVPTPAPGRGGAEKKDPAREKADEYARLRERSVELFGQKKYAEAAEACRRLIALRPRAPDAHYDLACALARLEKKDEALASLAKAAELGFDDPTHAAEDEDLAGVRDDERFRRVLARLKANEAARTEKGRPIPGTKTVEGAPERGLRYRLRLSPSATRDRPHRLVIWMHPSGGSMDSIVEPLAPRMNRRGFALLVFTKKDYRFWSSEDLPRLAVTLDDAARVEGITDDRPVLLGFSAGGQMALTLWSADPAGLGGIAVDAAYPVNVGPGGQPGMDLPKGEAARKVPLYVLVGTNDGGCASWREAEPKLREAKIPVTIRYVPGKVHEWLLVKDEIELFEKWLADRAAEPPPAGAKGRGWRPPAEK